MTAMYFDGSFTSAEFRRHLLLKHETATARDSGEPQARGSHHTRRLFTAAQPRAFVVTTDSQHKFLPVLATRRIRVPAGEALNSHRQGSSATLPL